MRFPSVSVIMAVYNGEAFIREALASVRSQSVAPLETIVIDDGSTDRTAELVQGEPGVTLLQQRNAGASAARNAGLARASGDWIAFLDADDIWMPCKLEKQLSLALAQPELGMIAGRHLPFLEQGMKCPAWLNPQHLSDGTQSFVSSVLLCRRALLDRIGLFNESLRFAEDFEWVARARAAGVIIGSVPEIVLRRRVHASNTSHQLLGAQGDVTGALMQIVRQRRAAAPHA